MDKILITGGSGLVGKAIQDIVKGNSKYIFTNSKDADLSDYQSCFNLLERHLPNKVIHLAANVGGLFKNMEQKVGMFEKNLLMNYNIVKCCHIFGIKKFIGCLSTCIFPDKTSYPINESMLHDGPPHFSNDGYAYAKRMLEIHCKMYREQFGDDFICIIPTNIYGPNDNFSLTDGHVIPSLIHKCYLAKKNEEDFIVSGSGKPLRQFIYSLDLAKILINLLDDDKVKDSIILSTNPEMEVSITKIANLIAKEFDYVSKLRFDKSKSDGQYRKTADNSKLQTLGLLLSFTEIDIGIRNTIKWFIDNFEECRK